MPELLRTLELAGCIVTLDAMGCQRRIAREIQEADADYVLALKGNQALRTSKSKAISTPPSPLATPPSSTARRWKKATVALRRAFTGRAATSAGLPSADGETVRAER